MPAGEGRYPPLEKGIAIEWPRLKSVGQGLPSRMSICIGNRRAAKVAVALSATAAADVPSNDVTLPFS